MFYFLFFIILKKNYNELKPEITRKNKQNNNRREKLQNKT